MSNKKVGVKNTQAVCLFTEDKPHVALLDSGIIRTLVRPYCLPRDVVFIEGKVSVWCVHGNKVEMRVSNTYVSACGWCNGETSIPGSAM